MQFNMIAYTFKHFKYKSECAVPFERKYLLQLMRKLESANVI